MMFLLDVLYCTHSALGTLEDEKAFGEVMFLLWLYEHIVHKPERRVVGAGAHHSHVLYE